jgi:hypothetical protein
MSRRNSLSVQRVFGVAVLVVAAACWPPGLAAAKTGPSTTTTTTTAAPGTTFITFFPGGGFAFGAGSAGIPASTGPFGSRPSLHRVRTSTTSTGVVVRVYAGTLTPGSGVGSPSLIPTSCLPDHELLLDVSNSSVVGSVTVYSRSTQPLPPQGAYVGQAEGSAIAVAVVQVPAGTRQAVMHFAGGRVDTTTTPVNNFVILAAPVTPPPVIRRPVPLLNEPAQSLGTLTITDQHGHRQELGPVRAALGYPVPSSCLPRPPGAGTVTPPTTVPLALPQPTGPPPADPGPARQAIETAYHKIFEAKAERNPNLDPYLEGSPVLTPAEVQQLQAGYGDITGKLKVRINDFRFLNPTTAALNFDLLLYGQPITATTIGQAVLNNGQWKVARATFCTIIMRANIACG